MLEALLLVFGFLVGVVVTSFIHVNSTDGDLYINTADPDYAACGFQFKKGADEIAKRRVVVIKVHAQK